ncbi:hypothetical protein IAU60_000400 [Kwoniella sp. DSM 27419]
MPPYSLLLPLVIRSLSLLLPHTYFQPDEFYQAFEPAHHWVFGYGYLTWEWRDLPAPLLEHSRTSYLGSAWEELVVRGRMRGWIWPGVFAGIYKLLQALGVDHTDLIVFAPRVIGVVVAALTDWYTYHLANKVLGPGASASALFLSLTSLFNAHLLPRALSTSPETLLTVMALYHFPFLSSARSQVPDLRSMRGAIVGEKTVTDSGLDYVVLDRNDPQVAQEPSSESLALSVALATLALCIRPTTMSLWAYLGLDLLRRRYARHGIASAGRAVLVAGLSGIAVIVVSTCVDYYFAGRVYFPALTFVHQNVLQNISSFYGSTNQLYHLTQSLPIMLFPIWWWWGQGFIAALLPERSLPRGLRQLDRPEGLSLLARATAFSILVLSLSPHSEWRFLHPFLPPLLLFPIPAFARGYTPNMMGCYRLSNSIRQYVRMGKLPFYLTLCSPVLPYLYLNLVHGAAQVSVMNVLRRGELGQVKSLVALMPCHSTPWASALHQGIEGWFVTCEPPIGIDPKIHRTQQEFLYQSPVSYLEHVFPYPPAQLHDIPRSQVGPVKPSHVLLFGELLKRTEGQSLINVQDALHAMGYSEIWSGWNGFDLLQDEEKRRGGVRVWRLE